MQPKLLRKHQHGNGAFIKGVGYGSQLGKSTPSAFNHKNAPFNVSVWIFFPPSHSNTLRAITINVQQVSGHSGVGTVLKGI